MRRLILPVREAMTMFLRLIGHKPLSPRKPGMFAGQIKLKPGFDELPEGFEAFEQSDSRA